ncbi:MAG TPA: hypothetical protein VHG28_21855 [Longimicrobiaceae bacterium]|nr:hypothetical protein [Longimicrobiaceae bacterium]
MSVAAVTAARVSGADLRVRTLPPAAGERAVAVPGDKSISHRILLAAAAGDRPVRIVGLNPGSAVGVLVPALGALGCALERAGAAWLVRPPAGGLPREAAGVLDLGPSSAAARLLLGLLAGAGVRGVVTGDATLRSRPMDWVVDPLRELGADLRYLGEPGRLPVYTGGAPLHGGRVRMRVGSAQAGSAVMFAAFAARVPVEVELEVRSRDHTERLLEALGVGVHHTGMRVRMDGLPPNLPGEYHLPGDPSAAAFLAAAHVLRGGRGTLRLPGVGTNPTRMGFFEVLRACGVPVREEKRRQVHGEPVSTLVVGPCSGSLRPFTVSDPGRLHAMIDEVPLAAALAASLPGRSRIGAAGELVFKETNRLVTTRDMLRAFGARVEVEGDAIVVQGGGPLAAGAVPSFGDHRIAMAAAVLASSLPGETTVLGGACFSTSFPGFDRALSAL